MYQPVIVSAGLMPVGRVYPERMVVDMEPGTSNMVKVPSGARRKP
jgi:hypothetical protein